MMQTRMRTPLASIVPLNARDPAGTEKQVKGWRNLRHVVALGVTPPEEPNSASRGENRGGMPD